MRTEFAPPPSSSSSSPSLVPRPLFTLQHRRPPSVQPSTGTKSKDDNGVSSLCFLTKDIHHDNVGGHDDDDTADHEHDLDPEDQDEDRSLEFQCRSRTFPPKRPLRARDDNSTRIHVSAVANAASLSCSNLILASSHVNGDAWLWDLAGRRVSCPIVPEDSDRILGPGLTVRRIPSSNTYDDEGSFRNDTFLYQTRDVNGTLTIHDPRHGCKIVSTYPTYSQTFCAAVPLTGHDGGGGFGENLVAMPSKHEAFVTVRDLRVSSSDAPVAFFHGAGSGSSGVSRNINGGGGALGEGMLMAMSSSTTGNSMSADNFSGSNGLVLACGMESGSVYFHDLCMLGRTNAAQHISQVSHRNVEGGGGGSHDSNFEFPSCSISLGKDPILCLDTFPSHDMSSSSPKSNRKPRSRPHGGGRIDGKNVHEDKRSIVAIAGMAGDAIELASLPNDADRGTIAIIKATSSSSTNDDSSIGVGGNDVRMKARVRACAGPCITTTTTDDDENKKEAEARMAQKDSKPGINTIKFRPDGRVFATGGWDRRLRIYSRTSGRPLATFHGPNTKSVTCMDWGMGVGGIGGGASTCMGNSRNGDVDEVMESGILATGSDDGKISLWRAFPC